MALRASLFGAIAMAGQRCTSARRVMIHECIYEKFRDKLSDAYKQIKIGNPLNDKTVMGPLVVKKAVDNFIYAQNEIVKEGGKIAYGGQLLEGPGYE